MADPGFSQEGVPTPKIAIIFQIFAENCMKMKDFGPLGGHMSLASPLDPPMIFMYWQFFTNLWIGLLWHFLLE